MSVWNRIALEHWLATVVSEPELVPYALGLWMRKGYIPVEKAVESGIEMVMPEELRNWYWDLKYSIDTYNAVKIRIPDAIPPIPYPVIMNDRRYSIQRCDAPEDVIFPTTGIYIYYHPYEGYKIGQAENIPRRMEKHYCSAPSAKLLHVIETSDLDWCERFIHNERHIKPTRRRSNHEYFDLDGSHLLWLFSIDELNRPKSIGDQLSLLDLL